MLSKLHVLSGTLNNVNHHISQFLQESDTEVTHYKNIIRHKLRPQLEDLVARNRALAHGEANQAKALREENTELRVKVRELQKKLEQRVSHSKERVYKLQIQKLQGEVEKNKTEIGKLDLELKRHTSQTYSMRRFCSPLVQRSKAGQKQAAATAKKEKKVGSHGQSDVSGQKHFDDKSTFSAHTAKSLKAYPYHQGFSRSQNYARNNLIKLRQAGSPKSQAKSSIHNDASPTREAVEDRKS